MKDFKKKLFTNIILCAKSYNTKHKNNSKFITFLALGFIVFLSIILYIPEKIIAFLQWIWNIIRKRFRLILIGAVCISLAVFIISKVQSFKSNKTENASTISESDDANLEKDSVDIDSNSNDSDDLTKTEDISEAEDNANLTVSNSETDNKVETALDNTSKEEAEKKESIEDSASNEAIHNESVEDKDSNDAMQLESGEDTKNTESIEDNNNEADNIEANKLYPMDEYLSLLKENYPDSIGWVFFEDGSISYPIMQGDDNQKYLSIGYDGNPADTGAIFLDCRSAADFSDSNSIIYGHNMKDRTMFGTLRNFRNIPGYYRDHEYFYIVTAEKTYKYQIFAYMDVPNNYVLYDYVGEASKEFVKDAEPVRLKSYMDSEIPVNIDKKVVTLSTCTDKDDLRFVVLGVMVDDEQN